ncbi:MAG: hypothetical protein KF716_12645 [Anaerolineae bacterium]|nr:hypothetical protein [Anaerolineae bacterium]
MAKMFTNPVSDTQISYRWALDASGRPIPIEEAERGGSYVCPLCHSQMIPRLGNQNQHHYGHETLTTCTPETVNRAVLRRWLSIHLTHAISIHRHAELAWSCLYCEHPHQADLLTDIVRCVEGAQLGRHYADIALYDAENRLRGVILIQPNLTLEQEQLFVQGERFVLTLPHSATPDQGDLLAMLRQATVLNGTCPVLHRMPNLVRDADAIRSALKDSVERYPGYFYGALESVSGLGHVVRMGEVPLFITRDRWKKIVGGDRNQVSPGVEVFIQTWQHADSGTLYLYFVTARETQAIGVRRYSPGAIPTLQLDASISQRTTTAYDIARRLVAKNS